MGLRAGAQLIRAFRLWCHLLKGRGLELHQWAVGLFRDRVQASWRRVAQPGDREYFRHRLGTEPTRQRQ